MSKKFFLTVAVFAVIILAIGYFFLTAQPAAKNSLINIPAALAPEAASSTQLSAVSSTNSEIASPAVSETASSTDSAVIKYQNNEYGFIFLLPLSWQNYSIVAEKWSGQMIDSQAKLTGPKILIRHPEWTVKNMRQDIPIMIFTSDQWKLIEQEKLAVSAAPIGPTELGHNDKYVFALPARYNFAFLPGFEEVEQIMQNNPLSIIGQD